MLTSTRYLAFGSLWMLGLVGCSGEAFVLAGTAQPTPGESDSVSEEKSSPIGAGDGGGEFAQETAPPVLPLTTGNSGGSPRAIEDAGVTRAERDGGGAPRSDGERPPDASRSTSAMDAGVSPPTPDDSARLAQAMDAGRAPIDRVGELACDGIAYEGVCWYLGRRGEACNDVCQDHGGVHSKMASLVGTREQGGSLEHCQAVMLLLAVLPSIVHGTRSDRRGLGCHLFDGADHAGYWLASPVFRPDSELGAARLACGCER